MYYIKNFQQNLTNINKTHFVSKINTKIFCCSICMFYAVIPHNLTTFWDALYIVCGDCKQLTDFGYFQYKNLIISRYS